MNEVKRNQNQITSTVLQVFWVLIVFWVKVITQANCYTLKLI